MGGVALKTIERLCREIRSIARWDPTMSRDTRMRLKNIANSIDEATPTQQSITWSGAWKDENLLDALRYRWLRQRLIPKLIRTTRPGIAFREGGDIVTVLMTPNPEANALSVVIDARIESESHG